MWYVVGGMCVCTYMYVHVCVNVCVCAYMCAYMCVRVYVYVCVCVCVSVTGRMCLQFYVISYDTGSMYRHCSYGWLLVVYCKQMHVRNLLEAFDRFY